MNGRKSGRNCVYNISYHIVWIPKYRKRILKNNIKYRLIELLHEKANNIGIKIENVECMDDHIHMFIRSNPKLSVSFIVKSLKGFTSYMLRKEFSFLKKYKHLWTNSYFCETIGQISEKIIKIYINNQTKHHIKNT